MSTADHSAVFRECLVKLDVPRARRLWAEIAPHLSQPATDEETLITMHGARLAMKTIPQKLRDYSRDWLAERCRPRYAVGVGIAVKAPTHRAIQAEAVLHAMEDAVQGAVQDGVDLKHEAREVKRRMDVARDKAM